MNLIENYASEVGRHLPRRNRADIEAEIRSALQDLLDERSRETGKTVDEGARLDQRVRRPGENGLFIPG